MLSARLSRLTLLLIAGVIAVAGCGGAPAAPTAAPAAPTAAPAAPTPIPVEPTIAPTVEPTIAPTVAPTAAPTVAPSPTTAPLQTSDPITGAPALARGSLTQRPYILMLDNHPNAYPQTGLDKAAVVFEALAEFGLTRFMAVYIPGTVPEAQQIGPVRSARLYFVQWALGLRGIYGHAGGSPEALTLLAQTTDVIDLDALFRVSVGYYGRSNDRPAPHNLYTSGGALDQAALELNAGALPNADEIGFLFKSDAPEADRPASQLINYFFLYKEDDVSWQYDPATNSYLRIRRTAPARDAATGEQLRAKNVIVMEVFEAPIPGDDKGRIEQQVLGEGRARLFMDGLEREVIWRKSSAEAQLSFFDPTGAEVQLNPGQVWLVALPSLENLTVS
jgi:hypothetical protein